MWLFLPQRKPKSYATTHQTPTTILYPPSTYTRGAGRTSTKNHQAWQTPADKKKNNARTKSNSTSCTANDRHCSATPAEPYSTERKLSRTSAAAEPLKTVADGIDYHSNNRHHLALFSSENVDDCPRCSFRNH